ncbi:hypothetical protein SNE40_020620 [Patella caerulea]|uniref:G-protein coupled receptors family 1 profile domain-containing protein n=1 Tax=Patella caerulea TaxID=87958 RepID=A0AAN8PFZ6_PATCE
MTITAFTCERYVAIVHPMRGQKISILSRAVKVIVFIWILAGTCALPYPIHTRIYHFVTDPRNGKPISDSLLCNIPYEWIQKMTYMFQVSTFVFFVIPMTIITVMYVLIGVKLRQKEIITASVNNALVGKTAASRARKAVVKMLVAVVVAFFVCWAPFHAQRLMTLYVKREQWTPELLVVQSYLFYVSGVLYFLSCTINPILYNLLSRKYRQAFKRTLCRCCIDLHSLPTFYKLKAKFIGKDGVAESSPLEENYHHPAKAIRMTKFSQQDFRKHHGIQELGYPSTKETSVRQSYPSSSSGSAHAHSDGRLQQLCRHKYCSSRRARFSTFEESSSCRNAFISYPQIINRGNSYDSKYNFTALSAAEGEKCEIQNGWRAGGVL